MKTCTCIGGILTLAFITMLQSVSGQTTDTTRRITGAVHLQYKYYADSTVLRWGYDHPQLWYAQIGKPVSIYRRDVTNDKPYEKIGEVMNWDSTRIETLAAQSARPDELVIVLENLHRHWGNTTFNGYGSVLERNDNFYNRWSLVHLAADMNAAAATVAGLRWVDRHRNPKTTYAYKVVAEESGANNHTVAFPVVREFRPVLFDVIEGDSVVTLQWEKKLHDYHFTAYWIEQSGDGKKWNRLNTSPFVQMTDVNVERPIQYYSFIIPTPNYERKYYRIAGLDAFGEVSMPSGEVVAMARDRTPPPPPQLMADTVFTHLTKQLSWLQDKTADVAFYHLERQVGNEVQLIPNWAQTHQTMQVDTLHIEGVYRYRLVAIDTAGNASYSEPVYTKVYDLVPPAPPVAPQVKADTTGYVVLTWPQHPEKDIVGYNIYAADGKGRSFIKLNAHVYPATLYIDSINVYMLTQKRYYKIVAVDNDHMMSDASKVVVIDRPDKIPPSPALIGDYRVLEDGIRLTVLPSSSRDVVRHELQRKQEGEDWKMISSMTMIPPSYLDQSVAPGVTYTYRVLAIEDSGLTSHSVKDVVITAMHPLVESLVLQYEIEGDSVFITMGPLLADKQGTYQLYRKENTGSLQRIVSTPSGVWSEKIKPENIYTYRAQRIDAEGRKGALSDAITVQLPNK